MEKTRIELHMILENILGIINVYFQPPENLKLSYPCIVYERSGSKNEYADNLKYLKHGRYTVTYIDQDPDSHIISELEELPYCTFDRHFISDNRNHWVFTIYI